MLETKQQPYEFLARWNDAGEFQGAHAVFMEIKSFDGEILSRTVGTALTPQQAAALGFPFKDVISEAHLGESIRADKAEARVAELEKEAAAKAEAHAAELAAKDGNLQALLGEVAALKTEADAMQAALTEAQKNENAGFFTKLGKLFN